MTQAQAAAPNERSKRIAARKARIRELVPRMPTVRVEPASDAIRKALRHPGSGAKFPASGSVEWPHDQFTKRRVKEGSVTLAKVEAKPTEEAKSPADEAKSDAPEPRTSGRR